MVDKSSDSLVQSLCMGRIEEEILYPQAREALDEEDRDLIDEAEVEHASIKQLVAEIERATPDDGHFDARIKVVGEYVQHHVKEEESGKDSMFAQARKAEVDLVALRDSMMARKQELLAQAKSGGLPPAGHPGQ